MKIEVSNSFPERGIYYYTRRSFYFHLLIFVIILVYTFLFAGKTMWNTKVSIVESAVRVDIVAMPKYTIEELKAFEGQSASFDLENGIDEELAKVDDPTKVAFLIKKRKEDFASMIKKIGKNKIKVTKSKKRVQKKELISRSMRKELKNLVLAGNKLSQGTAFTGKNTAGEMTVFKKYISSLPTWVRPKWKLPSYLLKEELKCRVQIFLKSNGDLVKATIFESSSNKEYDERALFAVRNAAPFPPVPNEIKSRVSSGEIVLGFPL